MSTKQLLTFDFGGTFVKYGVVDQEGKVSDWGRRDAPLGSADAVCGLITGVFSKYREHVDGVAVSIPGIVNSDTGELYFAGAYTPVLAGKNMVQLLRHLPVRIAVENDGKAAALAELWKGSLTDVENGAVLVLGSALAGGIIVNGKLCKGAHFSAGEFSLLTMRSDTYDRETTAGKMAGTSALLSRVAAAKGMSPSLFEIAGVKRSAEPGPARYTGKDIFRWMDEGDTVVRQVYREWLRDLVHLLFNLKMTLDPERIAIGGGISANDRFLNDLREEYENTRHLTYGCSFLQAELVRCRFGSDANLVGAAYHWFLRYGTRQERTVK